MIVPTVQKRQVVIIRQWASQPAGRAALGLDNVL